jgi:hypothetical protein
MPLMGSGGCCPEPVLLNYKYYGWPADGDWQPLLDSSGHPYADPNTDSNGSKNFVGDATNASASQ